MDFGDSVLAFEADTSTAEAPALGPACVLCWYVYICIGLKREGAALGIELVLTAAPLGLNAGGVPGCRPKGCEDCAVAAEEAEALAEELGAEWRLGVRGRCESATALCDTVTEDGLEEEEEEAEAVEGFAANMLEYRASVCCEEGGADGLEAEGEAGAKPEYKSVVGEGTRSELGVRAPAAAPPPPPAPEPLRCAGNEGNCDEPDALPAPAASVWGESERGDSGGDPPRRGECEGDGDRDKAEFMLKPEPK